MNLKNISVIAVLAVATTIISCENKRTETVKNTEQVNEAETVADFPVFDWSEIQKLKNNTIKKLKRAKSEEEIVLIFWEDYHKLTNDYNEILYQHKNYENLYNLLWAENPDPLALQFRQDVETNGFGISQSEGYIYLVPSTAFVRSEIIPLLNPISAEYLTLHCESIDRECCSDGAIIISIDELVNRIHKWGEFYEKIIGNDYKELAESQFYAYLSLLFFGIENTPVFNFRTKKLENKEVINLMNKHIETHPTSKATEEFKLFLEKLEEEDFKNTEGLQEFWLNRHPHIIN